MAFGSQVDDAVYLLVLHQFVESVEVADIHLDKLVVGPLLNVLQVGEVSSIRQLVQVDNAIIGILVHKKAYNMRSDKACTACNYYLLLISIIFFNQCTFYSKFKII